MVYQSALEPTYKACTFTVYEQRVITIERRALDSDESRLLAVLTIGSDIY